MIHLPAYPQRVTPPERNAWTQAVLEFAAEALRDLPQAIALHLDVPGSPLPVVFTTGLIARRPDANAASDIERDHGFDHGVNTAVVFDRDELHALVLAVEADRIWHREFLGFCFEKWRTSSFRVTEEIALAGANPDSQRRWSTARVFLRLQARITDVEWLDSQIASDGAHAHAASPALWAAA
ncbi:MAG TPA: hypothetical protein VHZ95_06545 [Polyangiales bacterium]|nr:hypothetical protein [Polyangiales bacterium]